MQTTCGTFTMRLDVKDSPKTTASFASLVRKGFYDGLTFHRISPGFVIQGGDPLGRRHRRPWLHGRRAAQAVAALHARHGGDGQDRSRARRAPRAASSSSSRARTSTVSQALTPDYALLGKVASGGDVVQRIGTIPADPQTEQPNVPVVIKRITVATK